MYICIVFLKLELRKMGIEANMNDLMEFSFKKIEP